MSQYPRRADHFREWSKLMLEQAVVPERVQYKSNASSSEKSIKGVKTPRGRRRKRFRRKRTKQE